MTTAIQNQMAFKLALALQELSNKVLPVYDACPGAGVDTLQTAPIWASLETMRREIGMAGAAGPGGLHVSMLCETAGWCALASVSGSGVQIIGRSTVEEGPELARDRCCTEIKRLLGL